MASIEAMGFESYASGDYRLSLASPAIDAAADGVTDLGCYERAEASEAEVDIVFSSPRLIAGEILTASAKVRGFESGAISYLWTFEDAPGADSQSIVHDTTGESGRQSVRVTVTQGAVSAEITRSYYVAQKDIHVSAANEIGDAIENAADGCVIWLANGNYQIDTSYYVDKGITIRSEAGELSETDVIIRRNTSKDIRPFFLNHPAAELRGLVISGGNGANDENIRGGNIIIGANGGRVINCIVQDGLGSPKNYTYCRGGNIYMAGESSLVSNCVIRNGQDASNYQGGGGGIFIDAGLVTECIITNNQCFRGNGQLDGSGVCMAGGTVANCLIAHNYEGLNNQSGRIGGAVRLLANSSALLTGCTIVKNVSRYSKVAGVIASGGTVANCIIAGNETLSDKAADAVWSGTASRFVNCLGDREIVGGVNSLAVANAAAVSFEDFDAGNYLLTYASPARNAGNNEFAVGNLDLAGNERIDDETIDIGAFEFTLGAAKVVECSADISRGLFPLEVTFTPHIAGFSAGELQCVWTFTRKVGGEVMTSGAVAAQEYTHTFTEPGYYDVELTASDGNDSASYSYENFIAVCAPDIYVVPEPSPENAVFPYATPETAGGIDDGISAAIDGCTVWIANGRYSITQGFTIANSVTIRSFSGELSETNVVIKRADGSDARPFYLAHPEAELRGLVISGGNGANNQTDKGGNVWISVEGGSLYNCIIENGILNTYTTYGGNLYVGADSSIVSNCILRGGQATGQYSGYGSGAYLAAGLITHCVITNNNGYRANGGAMGLQIAGGSAENCLIAGNYDSSTQNPAIGGALVLTGGKAVNCTIADNLASVGSYCAGVNCAAEAKVYNCIIAGNSATHASSTAADKVWRGTAENFENCVTDFEIVGGESCKLAPTQAILVNYPKFTIGRHSAALNAGNNAHSTAETDLSGCRRITHSTIDAGCYEADFEYGTSILLR